MDHLYTFQDTSCAHLNTKKTWINELDKANLIQVIQPTKGKILTFCEDNFLINLSIIRYQNDFESFNAQTTKEYPNKL